MALATSGSLKGAPLLHNGLFSVEEWDGLKWVPSGELALFSNTAFLNEEKLYHVHFHEPTNSVTYSFDKGADHRSGRLFFTDDHRTFSGAVTVNNRQKMLRGNAMGKTFDTQLKKRSETKWSAFKPFSFETHWDGDILKWSYRLGDDDITNRTSVTSVDRWRTSIVMMEGANPVLDGKDKFSIVIDLPPTTFSGTYTDASGDVYDWKGTEQAASRAANSADSAAFLRFDKKALRRSIRPSDFSMDLRAAVEKSPGLSVTDLMNVSCWVSQKVDGKDVLLDTAQVETGKNFQLLLQNALEDKWAKDILGGRPPITDQGLKNLLKNNSAFFTKKANMNLGHFIHDGFKLDPKHKDLAAKIDMYTIEAGWKALAQDEGYAQASSALYIESYRLKVPGIHPYLNDPGTSAEEWGRKLYEFIISDSFLSAWRVQVANGQFKNVKQQIYEWHTQLSVLAPNKSYAKDMVHVTFAAMLHAKVGDMLWSEEVFGPYLAPTIQNMINGSKEGLDKALQTNAEIAAEILQWMVSQFGTIETLVNKIVAGMTTLGRINAMQGIGQQAPLLVNQTSWDVFKGYVQKKLGLSNEQVQSLKDAGKVVGNVLKCVLYGAGAGFLIYEMIVGGGNVVDKVINGLNLGVMSLGLLVGSIEALFALKIGAFIEGQLATSTSQLGKFALGLTKWFGEGLPAEMGWITKVFTTSAADFIKFRIGPALAFVGLAVTGYQLYKAIKSGDVRNIVFESLNAFVGLVGVVTIGLELFSVAWAGPAGLVIAIIGGIVALIQLIWNLVSPPAPPPDPIELFVKGPLTDEGFTKFPRKYTPKANDTVTIVAKQFYGPSNGESERPRPGLRLAPKKLYDANRNVVGANIDIVLKPQQVLSIPHVVKYIVVGGDTYPSIAKEFYGAEDKANKVISDNHINGDGGDTAGTELLLWDVP